MISEQRQAKRKWINTPAVLLNANGQVITACRTIDVSETGAKLKLLKTVPVSGSVIVVLSGDGSIRRNGTIAWQKGREAGVQFDKRYAAFNNGPALECKHLAYVD